LLFVICDLLFGIIYRTIDEASGFGCDEKIERERK